MSTLRTKAHSPVKVDARAVPRAATMQALEPVDRAQHAERALLGAFLLSGKAFPRVGDLLAAEDFECDDHREIFEAIRALHRARRNVDTVTLREELQRRRALFRVGGDETLLSLTDTIPVQEHLATYAAIVKERARARALQQSMLQGLRALRNGTDSAEVLAAALRELNQLASAEAAANVFTSAAELETRRQRAEGEGETTSLELHELGGELRAGDLAVVPPSAESRLHDAVFQVLAADSSKAVALLSSTPEASYEALRRRVLEHVDATAPESSIDPVQALAQAPLHVGLLTSMRDVRRALEGLHARQPLQLVVLIGLRATSRSKRIAGLRVLANALQVPMLVSFADAPTTPSNERLLP